MNDLKQTFLKLFFYNWTWIKTPFRHLWFVWIRRFPRWRFLCLLILWNENPTTYANCFVTPRVKPTMWTHFFWVKQNLPKNSILTNLKKVHNKYIWHGINPAPPCLKLGKHGVKLPINWCKIVSINRICFGEGFMPSRSNVPWRLQKLSLARYHTSRGVIFHTFGRGREVFSDLHVGVNLHEKSKHV